jgi:hypothetical protein
MYKALCECQLLHPDSEDEDAGNMYTAFGAVSTGDDDGNDDDDVDDDDVR